MNDAPDSPPAGGATSLWNPNFLRWWLGLAAAALGDSVVYVAVPFLILDLGGGAGAVALALVAGTAPRFFGPVIGVFADRWRLRAPLAAATAVRGLSVAALGAAVLAAPVPLAWLYAVAFLNGSMGLFTFTAGEVALPHLVPRSALQRANSLLQAALMGLPLIGFTAGGLLVAALGPATTILAASVAFAPLAVLVLGIRFPEPTAVEEDPDDAGPPRMVRELRLGASFVLQRTHLMVLAAASFVLNASLNLLNVVVPLSMERRGFGAAGFGAFEGGISAGLLVGVGLGVVVANRIRLERQIAVGTVGFAFGFGTLALAFGTPTAPLPLLVASVLPLGIGLGLTEVAALTYMQLVIPDGLRGKVLGAIFTVNAAGLAAGAALAGALDAVVSVGALFGAAALLAAGLGATWVMVAQPAPAPAPAEPSSAVAGSPR